MELKINLDWIFNVILMSIRFGVIFFFTPILGADNIPNRIKILSTVILSFFFISISPAALTPFPNSLSHITLHIFFELINSAILAFSILCGMSAFKVAGRLVDLQIGFGSATLLDPTNRTNSPMLSVMFELLFISVLLGLNFHHKLIEGINRSFETMPLGSAISSIAPSLLINQFGLMFSLGVALIGTVMLCLLIVDIALGIGSKFMPQANIFILSMQLKTAIGIMILAISIPYSGHTLNKIISATLMYWNSVF